MLTILQRLYGHDARPETNPGWGCHKANMETAWRQVRREPGC